MIPKTNDLLDCHTLLHGNRKSMKETQEKRRAEGSRKKNTQNP